MCKMERPPSQPVKYPPNLVRDGAFTLDRLLSHIDPGPPEEAEEFVRRIYEQRPLTSPPIAPARLVVDTDVASFIFKWHPEFAPRYLNIVRGSELVLSFMTVAEMRRALWMRTGDPASEL
jgi:hypothetical protein